jgi:hypothetical protein
MRNVADPIVRYGDRRRIKGAGAVAEHERHAVADVGVRGGCAVAPERDRVSVQAGPRLGPSVVDVSAATERPPGLQRRLHYRLLGPVTLDHERAAIEGERDALKGGARQRGLSDHGRPPRRPDRRPSARRSSSRPRSRCRQSRWCGPSLGLGGTHIPARSCVLLEGVAREVCRYRGAVSSALGEFPHARRAVWASSPAPGVLRTFGRDRWCGLPARDPEGDARPVGHPPVGVAEQSHESGHE